MTRHPSLLLLLLCLTGLTSLSLSRTDTAAAPAAKLVRILNAHLGELPGLINADKTGPFVDLVRAIRNLQDADLLPYRFSTRSFGKVTHVLYSNTDHLITPDMAYGIVPTKRDLLIEATPGFLPIPLQRSMSIEQSLRKLSRGRIDAFIWAQEEADLMLRQLKLTNIHREHLGDFEDVFIIAKGPAGDETDRFLGEAIDRLAASGKLAQIYSRLHRPYVEWQPQPLPAADGNKTP
ncbi:TPA: ABC transporter substrate-binding protein [Aeromonas hydrophila subsp. hydrophila]|nr:ABC transporter substrate-binding protein [Aeromonas hydrophila subsp. hydrophila]